MSGPIQDRDMVAAGPPFDGIEVREGRATTVGGLDIVRVLPTKGRRTVGAWCFVDLLLPPDADDPDPMEVGPHPHIGLSTVTWLFEGEALHSDSLGSEQLIRPGQLNLMTSGGGIAHAELATRAGIKGVQMWVALPEATRHGASAFEHHAELPRLDVGVGEATVLAGSLGGVTSPARTDTPLVGADLELRSGSVEIPVTAGHEHAVIPVDRAVKIGDRIVEPGWLGLVPPGADLLPLETRGARLMLLGGEPLGYPIQMWWNFVARSRDELTAAWQDWENDNTDRFGPVPSILDPIDAPRPPWVAPD